jgi:glutamate-ammonia-ligase adenylyltransferase
VVSDTLTETVERSAAPAAVAVAIDRLVEAHAGLATRLDDDRGLRDAIVAVTAASRALTDVCLSDARAIEVLAALDRRPALEAEDAAALARWKRVELLRIAARDLLGRDGLETVVGALTALAGDVLDAAWRLAGEPPLAVIAMGKLGGRELNYASDIDVMFVGEGEGAARQITEVARTCFRVDADLRPEGRDGPLVRSLESFEAYWDRWAQTWEFQALLKARPVGGAAELGAAFLTAAQKRLWERPFTADDVRSVRAMKARAEDVLARKGMRDREVKRGRGGIRDIEFAVQLLQLVHGRSDPALRSPTTLDALAELERAGCVAADDARALARAYRFLRILEHRLQLVDEQQVHALPTDVTARTRLARVMGYRDTAQGDALEQLEDALRLHQATVRSIHERLFFRPLLETLAGSTTATLAPGEAETRLAAFGFTDAARTRQAVRELTRGLNRSSRLMRQLMPLLLEWLSESPDPDLGLLGLRKLSSGPQRTTELATAFRDSPEAARRLCAVLGTSALLTQTLEHHPDLISALGDPNAMAPRSPESLADGATTALAWRGARRERQAGLRRFKAREELRIAARDVLGLEGDDATTVPATARQLTALAEACVRAALDAVAPRLPFAVIAMGRFGGGELSYASDLDLLFAYDGTSPADFAAAERTAEALLAFLGEAGPSRIYSTDLGLRPEGKQGPLARSLDGYRAYYERWGQTWERQALVRARPVAGDAEVGRRFMQVAEAHVWSRPLSDDHVREIRRMKARIERERLPAGDDPSFHLKLGRGSLSDVEFTAQLLQLQHGVREPGTIAALDALAAGEHLDADDRAVLVDAYRFCERTRNRWFLVKGAPGDALPTQPEQLSRLARSLDSTPAELRESYRRVTRRARQVVQRLFYSQSDS